MKNRGPLTRSPTSSRFCLMIRRLDDCSWPLEDWSASRKLRARKDLCSSHTSTPSTAATQRKSSNITRRDIQNNSSREWSSINPPREYENVGAVEAYRERRIAWRWLASTNLMFMGIKALAMSMGFFTLLMYQIYLTPLSRKIKLSTWKQITNWATISMECLFAFCKRIASNTTDRFW